LAILADHIETYVNANRSIKSNTLVISYNNGQTPGPNPMISIRNKATTYIIQLMNELGLTPRSRLTAGKVEDNSAIGKLMRGPAF
jgi:phage terminase small subunit